MQSRERPSRVLLKKSLANYALNTTQIRTMNIRKEILNVLSTAFLVMSLVIAVGFSADAFSPQDAKANRTSDLEICAKGVQCLGVPTNCFCEVVVTPELE